MAVSDLLKDIGSGLATGARAVGSVAQPVLQRTAEVVSGQAPQIDEDKRKRQEKLEDEQIAAKAAILEQSLATGQKYGTLTPEAQQQYVDAITGLYSHPRHFPTLMEKLRKATHPNGAFASGPEASLPNAMPAGGTAAADEAAKEKAAQEARAGKLEDAEALAKYRATLPKSSTAKSPPLPGSQLPADATDPSGNPIGEADRNAGKSFVEWNGVWWPVAKPKPVFKTVKGHSVLVDAQSGAILRDLGPTGTAKVTSRQTLQPGDDGQMHLVTLTSVTTPEGATIEVQPETAQEPAPNAQSPAASSGAPTGARTHSTPAKKVNPGSILPKTGAKPTGSSGPVVPGLTTLAKSKNPMFKSDVSQYTKASEDARAKKITYENAVGLLNDPNRQTDLELIYAWVRANVQGAGRMTNTEINQAYAAGSFGTRINNAIAKASSGRMAPELEQQFLADIKRSYENAQKEADDLKTQLGGPDSNSSPTTPQPKVIVVSPEDMK